MKTTRFTRFRKMFGLEPKADVDAELDFHVEMRVRELIEQGETPDRARQRALTRFGDYDFTREACVAINERRKRRMDLTQFLTELRQDVGYAVRMMRRTPAFTAAALLTLALGIGANSAIFSVVNGVLLESLPFRDAERLQQLQMVYPDGTKYSSLSAPDFMSVRVAQRVFDQVEATNVVNVTLLGAGEPREVNAAFVTDGLFNMLGLEVPLGRTFRPDENQTGHNTVAILSHGFWQRAFGGDPNVLGKTITAGPNTCTIVGVASERASLPDPVDVFFPQEYNPTFDPNTQNGRRSEFLNVYARVKQGVDDAAVDADLK